MAEEGIEDPSDEDIRKFDRKRKGKKVSNDDWYNPHDPDAKITKMKDGRTHLAHKVEHAVDVKRDLILAAPAYHADQADTQTLSETLIRAQLNLMESGSDVEIKEVPADKGYHSNETVAWCASMGMRTYIPERESRHDRRWTDKSEEERRAVYNNRRRVRGKRGKALGRLRSEYTERSFAHVCQTGGARRSRLRELVNVSKRYLMYVAARNLGVMMRALFNMGTPKSLQTEGEASPCAVFRWRTDVWTAVWRMGRVWTAVWRMGRFLTMPAAHSIHPHPRWSLLCAA